MSCCQQETAIESGTNEHGRCQENSTSAAQVARVTPGACCQKSA